MLRYRKYLEYRKSLFADGRHSIISYEIYNSVSLSIPISGRTYLHFRRNGAKTHTTPTDSLYPETSVWHSYSIGRRGCSSHKMFACPMTSTLSNFTETNVCTVPYFGLINCLLSKNVHVEATTKLSCTLLACDSIFATSLLSTSTSRAYT